MDEEQMNEIARSREAEASRSMMQAAALLQMAFAYRTNEVDVWLATTLVGLAALLQEGERAAKVAATRLRNLADAIEQMYPNIQQGSK